MSENGRKVPDRPRPGKILIVDDNALNCDMLKDFFSVLAFDNSHVKQAVEFAYSGDQALKLVEDSIESMNNDGLDDASGQFSLILIECNMSLLSGFKTAKRIRKLYEERHGRRGSNLPLIVGTSCQVDHQTLQRAK